jgi:hypothetical protein
LSVQKIAPQADLWVGIHDQFLRFAYHKEDEKVIIGFYFPTQRDGYDSSIFEVIDDHTKDLFKRHIDAIRDRAYPLLVGNGGHGADPWFNQALYEQLYDSLVEKLGAERVNELMGRRD